MSRIHVELECPKCGACVGTGWVNEDSPAPATGDLCHFCAADREKAAQLAREKAEERHEEGDGCVGALALMLAPWVALAVTLIGVWKWC
jgi:hypothetical protein